MDEKAAQDLLHERSFIGRSMHSTLLANECDPEIRFDTKKQIAAFTSQICEVIVGKAEAVKLAVACLLARGHLLIEDIPGVGKTTLSQALARSLGLVFQRIQFTSDLLPADILGNSIFDRNEQRFVFHQGPLFSQVVLIDEVNRATAKTQSAVLEAMEEHQISADGVTYELPQPFFVIATQNPQYQVGTFPLPESQLDRFLMRIELGVPDRAAEQHLALGGTIRDTEFDAHQETVELRFRQRERPDLMLRILRRQHEE